MNGAGDRGLFEAFSSATKATVEAALDPFLAARVAEARRVAADAGVICDAVLALATRGGKRLRAVLVAAAYDASATADTAGRPITLALVAVELLQTYLLIHDDWMDGDDVRRGGPSVHALLRARFGSEREGAVAAILAGDYAAALALEALTSVPLPGARIAEAALAFGRIQADVVVGQMIDVRAAAVGEAAIEAMHDLKTGSYSVRGPIAIGAILGGASPEVRAALDAFARPLGVAFQLRDDLLGTFGDPARTGKPRGTDLRGGKRTALVASFAEGASAADRALLARVHGVAGATDADVSALAERIAASGAKARVEKRLVSLLDEARDRLTRAPLAPHGAAVLRGAIAALGERDS